MACAGVASVSYVPLWCKSNYSFLEGASHPEELVSQAVFMGLPAIAVTDRNGVYGLPRAHQRCVELDRRTKLLCGCREVKLEGTYFDRKVEQAFLGASRGVFEAKTKPSTHLAVQVGNMYTSSLYGGLASFITE